MSAYVVRCPDCGGVVGLAAIDPRWVKDTARTVSGWIKDGYQPNIMSQEETREAIDDFKFGHSWSCPRAKVSKRSKQMALPCGEGGSGDLFDAAKRTVKEAT